VGCFSGWLEEHAASGDNQVVLVLHVLHGPDRGKVFELPADEPQLIGRSSEALPIADHTVSRRHAELTPDDGAWYLRDLDSANGTFVNGERIADRVRLRPGDQFRCGSTLFVFALSGEDDGRPSPIQLLDGELDVTVEGRADPNADSMILAAPDPVRAARDHLRVIYDLTAVTARAIDRAAMLEQVMDLIFAEFEPDRGFILLGDDPRGRPISDTRFRSGDSVRDYGIRSAICSPITAEGRQFGIIQIDSQLANFTFTHAQLQLLNAIGRHTGLALLSKEIVESTVQTERLATMGETVASLSHSIKNMLQGLRGGADAVELALNRGDNALAREGWPILARNLDRIYTLTLNMLTFARPNRLEIELGDLHALVREAVDLVTPQADHASVGVILDLADDMPPVPFDTSGLHQALVNILMNAIEAAPPKRGVVTVKSSFDPRAHEVRVSVVDNGSGIGALPPDEAFEAFRTTKGQRGTGLGLAVTRKIAREHGGDAHLESGPDGTTVTIVLPSDRPDLDPGDTRLPTPAAPEPWEGDL
jgi:signal transduction histidine kinase